MNHRRWCASLLTPRCHTGACVNIALGRFTECILSVHSLDALSEHLPSPDAGDLSRLNSVNPINRNPYSPFHLIFITFLCKISLFQNQNGDFKLHTLNLLKIGSNLKSLKNRFLSTPLQIKTHKILQNENFDAGL